MNTATVIRADVSDLIAVAFYHAGYRPRESLFLLGLQSPNRQVGLVSRIDLLSVRRRLAAVEHQFRLLRRERCDVAVAVIVSEAPPPAGTRGPVRLPHRALVRQISQISRSSGIGLLDALSVGHDRWWSYRCDDVVCCPVAGHPLEEVLNGPVAAALVLQGHVLAASEEDLLADVAPAGDPAPPSPRAATDAVPSQAVLPVLSGAPAPGGAGQPGSVLPVAAQPGGASPGSPWPGSAAPVGGPPGIAPTPGGLGVPAAPRELPPDPQWALARWRELLADPAAVRPCDLGWLAEGLTDRWLRDAILLTLIPGSGTVPEEVLAGADCAAMDGVFDADPDSDLLERGRTLLSAVARTAPAGRRADALSLLAWAAWWSGHGTRGRLLAQRALADRPGHRLARLVDQLLMRSVAPAWVERRRPPAVAERSESGSGGADGCADRVLPAEPSSGS